LSAPLDVASGGLPPACAIVAFVLGCRCQPQPFAWPGEGTIDEAIRCRQLQPITIRRTAWTGALLSAEDADSPWTFSVVVEPSPSRVDL
jgi:hypothetical protein